METERENIYNEVKAFLLAVGERLKNETSRKTCVIAIDIDHFRFFNKMFGWEKGNQMICAVKEKLLEIVEPRDGMVGYFGADNYAVFVPDEEALILEIYDAVVALIEKYFDSTGFSPLFGICGDISADYVLTDIYDHATLALSRAKESNCMRICRYSADMEENLEKEIRLLSEIKEGLANGEFIFYAQPQCNISKSKIVGAEALVRWRKKNGELVPPGKFIPVLEKNGMIVQLDRYIWEQVCKWQRSWMDRGYAAIPISINVSRIDIFYMNVSKYLIELLEKYELPEQLIKVEITESAYAESDDRIITTVSELRNRGFQVLMDDFGSGYSSLNMLKHMPVDVLKLDMRFLEIEEEEAEKGINILETVVNMARLLRLPIVVEGVETEQQEQFIRSIGCRYTQGYYYYRPMPLEQFEELLKDDRRIDLNGLIYKQVEPLHIREFVDSSFLSDGMLNNVIGPVAFYEMFDNQIELTRVNEQYMQLIGNTDATANNYGKRFWNHVRADDRVLFHTMFEKAYENAPDGAEGYIHALRLDGSSMLLYMKVFFLKERNGKRQYYTSLLDVSRIGLTVDKCVEEQKMEQVKIALSNASNSTCEAGAFCLPLEDTFESLEAHFGHMPYGFAIARITVDAEQQPLGLDISYINKVLRDLCGGDINQLHRLIAAEIMRKKKDSLQVMYETAYYGKATDIEVYTHISNRYLKLKLYQYAPGYLACIMLDTTDERLSKKALHSLEQPFREIYYVHLQDNFCQMLYPTTDSLMERGNYEEMANRHFYAKRVSVEDESYMRRVLSLDNLRKVLKTQDVTELAYRRNYENMETEWCMTTFTVSDREADGTPKTAIMTIRSIESFVKGKSDQHAAYMSEALAGLSEGFFIYSADEQEKILYVNQQVMKMFGCVDHDEFYELVGHSFKGMVHPEDLERVETEINQQIRETEGNMDAVQYRIIQKDGTVRWLDDYGHLERGFTNDSDGVYYVFISDITDTLSEARKNHLINKGKNYTS